MEIQEKNSHKLNSKQAAKLIPSIEQLSKRVIEKKPKKKKKRYDVITYEKRVQLLEMILNEKETIKNAAERMGIKLCTAKHILYLYKKEGKVHQRKQDHQYSDSDDVSCPAKDQMKGEARERNQGISIKQLKAIQNQNKLELKSETNQSIEQITFAAQKPRVNYEIKKLEEVGLSQEDFTVQNFSFLMNQNAMLLNMLHNLLNPITVEQQNVYGLWNYCL